MYHMLRGGWKPHRQTNCLKGHGEETDTEIKRWRILPSAQLMFLQLHSLKTMQPITEYVTPTIQIKARLIVQGSI